MMTETKDLILLFDLDGTLWNSSQQAADSWNIVLRNSGLPASLPEFTARDIYSVMGRPMDEIARTLLPDLSPEQRGPLFTQCEKYEVEYICSHAGILYPDVQSTLHALLARGYKMAVVSNCQTGYIGAFYTSTGLGKYFCDQEEWGVTHLSKGENIRLVMQRNGFENAVYIGDTKGDFDSANQAGIPFIHAAYGFGNVPEAPKKILRFQDLLTLLPE